MCCECERPLKSSMGRASWCGAGVWESAGDGFTLCRSVAPDVQETAEESDAIDEIDTSVSAGSSSESALCTRAAWSREATEGSMLIGLEAWYIRRENGGWKREDFFNQIAPPPTNVSKGKIILKICRG